jgi:hypothetical protein
MASRISPRSTAVAVVAVVSFCGIASAQAPPNFLMSWDVTGDSVGKNTYNWAQFGNLQGFGTWFVGPPNPNDPLHSGPWTGFKYTGSLAGPSNAWNLQWDCVFNNGVAGAANANPAFVTANIVVTNNDVNNQTFSLLMTLPVTRVLRVPAERGSIVGTVTDLTGNNATVSAPGGSRIYTPRIDGVDEAPGFLMGGGFSANAGGPFQSGVVGPQQFGIPSKVPATQSVDVNIGIFLTFVLTPGDSASFTSIYEVNKVPGPGGLALLAALGLIRRRRR